MSSRKIKRKNVMFNIATAVFLILIFISTTAKGYDNDNKDAKGEMVSESQLRIWFECIKPERISMAIEGRDEEDNTTFRKTYSYNSNRLTFVITDKYVSAYSSCVDKTLNDEFVYTVDMIFDVPEATRYVIFWGG